MLDQGGLRRATLRGTLNLTKRHLAAVLVYDLSLLMRHLIGHGTPQWLAVAGKALFWHLRRLLSETIAFMLALAACRT
jgi:transposase